MPHVLGVEHRGVYFVLSRQAWLCGGSVEILPCSRVGHIHKNQDADSLLDPEATLLDKVRIAETWLGSFKETFYKHSPKAFSLSKVRRARQEHLCLSQGRQPRLGQGLSLLPVYREDRSFWLLLPLSCPCQVALLPAGAVPHLSQHLHGALQLVLAWNPLKSLG